VLDIVSDVISGKSTVMQHYCSGWIHNLLKQFHGSTETFCTDAAQQDLKIPKSHMFAQAKPLTEEEAKSMALYDLNEFHYPYKRVSGNYSYLERIRDKDTLDSVFDMIAMFILTGPRPHHIEADISRNLHAFGIDGHFPEDIQILTNWCKCLLEIERHMETHFKLSCTVHREKFSALKGAKNVNLFLDLIRVVRSIEKRLIKPPNWIERLAAAARL